MRHVWRAHLLELFRLSALVALTFSVALFVHYIDPAESGFCSGRSGCEAVRQSGLSYYKFKYLNVPALGVVAFGTLLALSMVPLRDALRLRLLQVLGVLGGVLALVLIVLQAVWIEAYCWMCLVVDGAAVACAFLAALLFQSRETPQVSWVRSGARWGIVGLLATSPVLYWVSKPDAPVPEEVRSLYEPGKINVVEFADFQCPFCRMTYPMLQRLNEQYGERVNFRMLHMPLPSHEHAALAASAAVCAEEHGLGKEMEELLFLRTLNEAAPLEHAKQLGLDEQEFAACLEDDKTEKRLEADRARVEAAGFRGLPTVFIGDRKIVGVRNFATFQEAYEAAAASESSWSIPGWLFWSLEGLALVALVVVGRRRT